MDRAAYIKSLDLDLLTRTACEGLESLSERRCDLHEKKKRIKYHSWKVELIKAALTLSEEYKAGKNEEIRKAWLIRQQIDNEEYANELKALEFEQDHADQVVIEISQLEGEFTLAQAEIGQTSATLRFMAGEA